MDESNKKTTSFQRSFLLLCIFVAPPVSRVLFALKKSMTTIYLRALSPGRFTAFAVRHPVSGMGRADPPFGLTRCCIG